MEQPFRSTAATGIGGAITTVAATTVGTAATTMAGIEATNTAGNIIAVGDDFHL